MKFLFLSSYAHLALDPAAERAAGGAELQVALLARELVSRGHEVVIVGGDEGQAERVIEGVRTRIGGRFHTGGAWDTLCALPRVLSIIREERPDYTCLLGWTAWLGFLLRARRFTKLVYICGSDAEVDGGYRRANRLRGWLFEKGVRGADQRFGMSEHQAGMMREAGMTCGMYRNLVMRRTDSCPQAGKDVDFLWVSRCIALKRPHRFLDLAEALPDARFEMIAPAEDRALFDTVKARAGRLANVEFHERVPYREVQRHFDRAEVFVNTSEFEGFPNTFIQAGQGGATILSLLVDPDELLSVHRAGLCAADDWETFLEDARELVADMEARRALQRRTAAIVADWHDNVRNVDAFLAGLPK